MHVSENKLNNIMHVSENFLDVQNKKQNSRKGNCPLLRKASKVSRIWSWFLSAIVHCCVNSPRPHPEVKREIQGDSSFLFKHKTKAIFCYTCAEASFLSAKYGITIRVDEYKWNVGSNINYSKSLCLPGISICGGCHLSSLVGMSTLDDISREGKRCFSEVAFTNIMKLRVKKSAFEIANI